jgi:hypothetical protein
MLTFLRLRERGIIMPIERNLDRSFGLDTAKQHEGGLEPARRPAID